MQRQFFLLFDHTAHIIRQTAVGIGHIAAALDYDDLRVFIQTADAGSGRSTARHTAYDHNFHLALSTIAAISDLGRQPTDLATAFPSLNTTSIGMLDT